MNPDTCPLCRRSAEFNGSTPTGDLRDSVESHWVCKTCGRYRIGSSVQMALTINQDQCQERSYLLSAYTKEVSRNGAKNGPEAVIDVDLLFGLGQGLLRERTVPEKMELAFRRFTDQSTGYGQEVLGTPDQDYPFGWCSSPSEWTKLVDTLTRERELLKRGQSGFFVTMKGWEWLEARPVASGNTAFVAMNFEEKYRELQKAITTAIEHAGYDPKVVNEDLFTGGIMDRVLARIREARFVVADYTGNRGGVYYEAGFALGLGKTVFHSCSQAQLDSKDRNTSLHFDVAHLHMIPWRDGDLSAYSERLKEHIEAVLGHGPVKAPPVP